MARARLQATDRLEAATRSLEQHAQQTRSVLLTAHERHAQTIHGSFAAAHDRVAATAQDAALRIGTERASHAATLAAAHAGSLTQGHAAFAAGQDRARGLGTTYASRAQQVADEVAAALQTTVHGHGAEARQIGETKAQRRFSEDSAEATAKVAHEIAADTAEKIEAGVDDGATQLQATGPQAAESFGQHAEEIATQVGAGEADLQTQLGGMFDQANSGLSELSAAGVEQMHHAGGPLHASLAKAQTELHAELQADVTRKLEQSDAAVANAANTLHVELHKALDAGEGEVGKLSRQVADAQVPERDAGDFAGRIRTHLGGSFGTIAEQAPRASQQIGSELDRATATTMSATAAAATDIGRQTQSLAGQATAQLGQQHAAIAGQLGSVATQATGNAATTIAQVGTGLTGKLGEIDQAFGKSLGDYRSSLSKQVTDADTKAKEPLSSLPSRIDQAQQRAEERSHKGFWERQWDDFTEMLTDPGFWAGLIVGLVLAVAVIALVVAGVLTGGLAIILAMAVAGAIAAAVGSIVGQATNHSFTGGWDWSRVDWKQVAVSALIGAAVAAALTGLVLYMGPAMAVTLKGIAIISVASGVLTIITNLVTGQPWDKNLLANMALAGLFAWLAKYLPIPGRGRTGPPREEPAPTPTPTTPRVITMQVADIQATPPERVGNTVLNWKLIDAKSGARFSDVDVDVTDPQNPGAPDQYLEPKNAKMPDGETVQLVGDPKFSFTIESLKANQRVWEQTFGRPLLDYSGSLADENLGNFQAEFAKIRTDNPTMSAQQVGNLAIREVSFGKGRISIGFGDLSVQMDGFEPSVTIKMGPNAGKTVENAPTIVKVSAKRSPPSGGEP